MDAFAWKVSSELNVKEFGDDTLCFSRCGQPSAAAAAKSLQLCPILCDPIDGSPPGSSVPGSLQARTPGVGCHFLLPVHESEKWKWSRSVVPDS